MWDNTFEGMKVEVKNTDCENSTEKMSDYFWVATVIKVSMISSQTYTKINMSNLLLLGNLIWK